MEQTKKNNPLGDILQEAMGKVREMVDAKHHRGAAHHR